MKGVIYVRQSLAKDDLGIRRQEAECRKLCRQRGIDVLRVIADNNVSATTGQRPGYDELIRLVERGGVDAVVVLRLDRLMRKLTELEALIELSERTGVQIVTVQGDLDISNAQGRLLGRILASVARSEVETKGERHRLANAQRAALGLPHGSRRAFGYEADHVTIREPEAAVLRHMASKLLSGWGFNDIAAWCNEQGYVTTTGKPFYGVTVANLLRKPRYGGYREHNGNLYKAVWQPVFDEATYERLQLELRRRSERDVPKSRKYLLTGLAECGRCGSRLNGSRKVDRAGAPLRHNYLCVGCRRIRRNAESLDWFVRECVLYRLDSPHMAALLSPADDAEVRQLVAEQQARRAKLDSLIDDYASGLLNKDQFARAKTTAEALLAETEAKLDKASASRVGLAIEAGERLRDAWQCNPVAWRRRLIELVIKRVVVHPSDKKPLVLIDGKQRRFDADSVTIEWLV